MIELPSIYETRQTLYSAIPLALNTSEASINEYHQRNIRVRSSDCLILSQNEMPRSYVQFFNMKVPLLCPSAKQGTDKKAKKKSANDNSLDTYVTPFTSILVGPSYSCHALMQKYFEWCIVQPQIFSSPHISYKKKSTASREKLLSKTKPNTNYSTAQHSTILSWQKQIIPKIWAQATLSHIKVTCMMPQDLQNELGEIFNYPIKVSSIAPNRDSIHNELLAWLFAIYAVCTAQTIFRTVICDSTAIEHQFQQWQLRGSNPFYPLKYICTFQEKLNSAYNIVTVKRQKLNHRARINKKNKSAEIRLKCEKMLLDHTDYKKKKFIYNSIHHSIYKKLIGFSSQHISTRVSINKNTKAAMQAIITIKKTQHNIHIELPLLLNMQQQNNIRTLLRTLFPSHSNTLSVKSLPKNPTPLTFNLDRNDCISSIIISECKKIPRRKQATVHITLKDIANTQLNSSIALCMELSTSFYSKKINISTIHVAIDNGWIVHKENLSGLIEYHIFDALYSVLGSGFLYVDALPQWDLHILNTQNDVSLSSLQSNYTTSNNSLPFDFYDLIQQSIQDAFSETNTPIKHFPILEHV